jgi:dienelactone hydrolase
MRTLTLAIACALWSVSGVSLAQPFRDALLGAAGSAPDLELPAEAAYLGTFSAPKMALYKPEGPGPFPAMVILHQCGGLRSSSGTWQNMAILGWAKEAVSRGYVALVLDSLGPRRVDSVCYGVNGGVNFPRGVRDALQAAEHLRKLPYVDRDRIAFAGFSWGAMVGLLASGEAWGNSLKAGERFRAVVAFYPGCFEIRPPSGRPYPLVQPDIDTPVLVLMGDLDTETPPQECTSRLEPLKAAGRPVDWHIYPEATHCWDCKNLDRFRKTDFRGNAVEYRYNSDVSKDSADRMFGFLRDVFEGKR